MAERRMFTQKITESDAFLEMPMSSQALYFHLCMNADDDGFVKNPKSIQRTVGCNQDDLKLLIAKRFVLAYESGVIVIKHWRMHNLLRKDRYKETVYLEEKSTLYLKKDGAYTLDATQGKPLPKGAEEEEEKSEEIYGNQMATKWQPNCNQMAPQDSIGKDSIELVKDSKKLKERKKEIYKNQSSNEYGRETYDEIMDRWEIGRETPLRAAFEQFIRHCSVNGQVLTNDRLEDIICRLYDYYGAGDKDSMCDSLKRAISGGYYDIKEGKR